MYKNIKKYKILRNKFNKMFKTSTMKTTERN